MRKKNTKEGDRKMGGKGNRSGVKNLKRFDSMTPEEAFEIRSRGGKASVERQRKKQTFKELVNLLGDSAIGNDLAQEIIISIFPKINREEITAKLAMVAKMYDVAINKGDVSAFIALRDTAGEKPSDKLVTENMHSVRADKDEVKKIADRLRRELQS